MASLLGALLPGGFDFAAPLALLLLPLPLLVARLAPPERAGGAGALLVPDSIIGRIGRAEDLRAAARRRRLLAGLLWTCLVVALAGPRLVLPATALPASGREIMLALDLSGSMERVDFSIDGRNVSRLAAVKQVGADFIRRRAGDRIGLVIFADQADVAASLSFDTAAVVHALEEAQIGLVGRSTGIGDGLGLALKRLDAATAREKVVILLSDGANNAGQTTPHDVAGLARDLGIRVHTIALGPRDLSDADGDPDVVDTEALRDVSATSGGRFFRVRTTDDLAAVADAIDEVEGGRAKAPPVPLRRDLWPWPGGLALLTALSLLLARRTA
ncbi:von Willebrand factor type A [Methylobacterium sp. 4-46]|uniref:VWA domain-containing protein n=1 Tax=unclassified Methylobacterium TaxID=2615210 RepID=UPI000152D5E6|nr:MULTISPECIES: VWA domain-containing protein [Methylobacterium]ACA15902.1 von Willebrand factor type A [Methylobacterium sp. 4-46]WFT81619.1 VWA domain-containing protein [Methylobacterium nodulans]